MPETMTLHDAFLDELRDSYDAEKQLIKALPKMARAADNDTLRTAFETHLRETQGHAQQLEQVFQALGERPRGKHCDGMAGIIEEGQSKLEEDLDGTTLDACLIAAAQRAEHYEMAAYGTLVAWAKAMGHDEAVGMLEQILENEKTTDEKLTQIAESGINQEAAQMAHGGAEGDDEETVGSMGRGSRSAAAATSGSSSRSRSASTSRSSGSRSSSRKKTSSSGSRKGGSSRKRR
jgi:ferritin-like metal-binding protein YciE